MLKPALVSVVAFLLIFGHLGTHAQEASPSPSPAPSPALVACQNACGAPTLQNMSRQAWGGLTLLDCTCNTQMANSTAPSGRDFYFLKITGSGVLEDFQPIYYLNYEQLQNRSTEIMLVTGTASCQSVNMSTYLAVTSAGSSFAYSQPCSYLTVKSGCIPDCARYLQVLGKACASDLAASSPSFISQEAVNSFVATGHYNASAAAGIIYDECQAGQTITIPNSAALGLHGKAVPLLAMLLAAVLACCLL
ncbi:hypothetical protein N2152v2_008074 [Parachlorella kessleri]